MRIEGKQYKTIWNENGIIKIIDQTKLPHQFEIKELNSSFDATNAIKNNASLLCNGVVKIHEDFNIGDGIEVVLNDLNVAKGIAKISSNEISDNIVLIHIDDLIIL